MGHPTFRLLALTLVPLLGCGALDFDVTQSLGEQEVRGDPLAAAAGGLLSTGGLFSNPFTFDVDVASETKARNTGPAKRVALKSLTLTLSSGSPTESFDFLEEVHVFVESRKAGSSLPRVEVAILAPVPRGARTLLFQVRDEVNLLPYVNEGTRVTTSARAQAPAKDVRFSGTVVLRITPT